MEEKEKEKDTDVEFKENLDLLNPNSYDVPAYALKNNDSMRLNILHEAGIMKPNIMNLFESLCLYASSQNNESGLVKVEDFCSHMDGKSKVEFGNNKKVNVLLLNLVEKLGEKNLGIIETLEVDSEGQLTYIVLLNRADEKESLYRKVSRLLLKNFQEVKEKKSQFKSYKSIKKEFILYGDGLDSLIINQSAKTIDQNVIIELAKKNTNLVVIDLEHDVGNIIVPATKINNLVMLFINLVHSYYQDVANDSLRKIMQKRTDGKKVKISAIVNVFRAADFDNPHFLFFSQLFYAIMNKLSEKFYSQNYVNSEVTNQLIASRFLTLFSFNLRERLLDKQVSKEKENILFKKIIDSLVLNSINKKGESIYYPASMGDFMNLSVERDDEKGKKIEVLIKNKLSQESIREYLKKLDAKDPTIPDVIRFVVEKKEYYVHRTRLIRSFLSMVEIEKVSLQNKILMMWISDRKLILGKKDQKKFLHKIDEEYCSPFFSVYFFTIVNILSKPSPISGKSFDSSYFLNRLFFDEREGLGYANQVGDLLYLVKDFNRKKQLLKTFFNFIFYKSYKPKEIHKILNINFFDLRKRAHDELGIGIASHFFNFFNGFLSGFFSKFSFMFSSKNSYISKVSKSLKDGKQMMNNLSLNLKEKGFAKIKDKVKKEGTSDKKVRLQKSNTEQNKESLLQRLPILKNPVKLTHHFEDLAAKWNYKMGEAREDFQDVIDGRIHEYSSRFDMNYFTKDQMGHIADVFINANVKISQEIIDKKAFGEYVFYKAAFFKLK